MKPTLQDIREAIGSAYEKNAGTPVKARLEVIRPGIKAYIGVCSQVNQRVEDLGMTPEQAELVSVAVPFPLLSVLLDVALRHLTTEEIKDFLAPLPKEAPDA